jgi:hypothetical protein
MKTKTSPTTNSSSGSPSGRGLFLIPFVLAWFACFALLPQARAVSPAPDGGYPGNNTAEGEDALFNLEFGINNTAIGFQALYNNVGSGALDGNNNTAVGNQALFSNLLGSSNTAVGIKALFSNTAGGSNVALGSNALLNNTVGNGNTATGDFALESNTVGNANTAVGIQALQANTEGVNNTATGCYALQSNSTGVNNIANGYLALLSNTTGNSNSAIGAFALRINTTGSHNIALGFGAGSNITTESNNIDIGSNGLAGESNTIRIGKNGTHTTTRIAGISGATVPAGVAVIVDATGHLGTSTSSAHYKEAIKPMDKTSEAILALKPVTFRYKHDLDPEGIPQFGLVAEEVEKVNPDLVARDEQGKPYTVRYEAVNAMLLNEFLKEHQKVEEQDCKLQEQGTIIARQQKQIEALTAGLQKVSAQLEARKSSPQIVLNDQ